MYKCDKKRYLLLRMIMEKLKMHSLNKVDENIAKIGQLFPNSLTERKNEKGEVEYAIDYIKKHVLKLDTKCLFR